MLPTPGAPSPLHRFPFTGLRRLLARLLRLLALLGLLSTASVPPLYASLWAFAASSTFQLITLWQRRTRRPALRPA